MIDVTNREQEIIQWHLPDDTEPYTVFYLKRQSGLKEAYLSMLQLNSTGEIKYEDWVASKVLSNIEKIENWKGKTLKNENDIKKAIDQLSENEIFLLLAAIKRNPATLKLGLIEKNSASPSA